MTHYYSTTGNLLEVIDPLLYETDYTYSSAGLRLSKTDGRGKVWEWGYSTAGHCTSAEDPYNNTTTTTVNTLGWPLTVQTPTGVKDTFTYDNLGRKTRTTHYADSSYTEVVLDEEGAVTSSRDEEGKVTTFVLNDMGWVTSSTDAESRTVSSTYSNLGVRTTLTDGRNKTTTWTLDHRGRVTGITYPDATTEAVTYTTDGQVHTRTDGNSNVVDLGYDTVGRLVSIDYPTGTDTEITYLANDWRDTLVDRTGTYDWGYNARGVVTSLSTPNGTLSAGYDGVGNRTSVSRSSGPTHSTTFDDASRPSTISNSYSESTSLTYNADSQVTQQVQPNGTKVLQTFATGSTGRGWLTVLEHKQSNNTLLARYEYTRDDTGRLLEAEQPNVHSVAYEYDDVYQLTRETRTGTSAYDISYTYDNAGNRLTKVQGGVTENYTYGDNNQLLTAGSKSYDYDDAGNLVEITVGMQTTTLEWDYNQKLTQITYPNSSTNTFQTNDLGQRTQKVDSGGTTNYLFDGSRVLADSRADYSNGGVTGVISERASGTSRFYHGDQLGSTRGLSDGTEAITGTREYDSWGLVVSSSGTVATPFKFAGGHGYQADADSGLMLLGARYYDASVGRFISRDPIGYEGGLNLYVYANSDPTNGIDPSGNNPWRIIKLAYEIWKRTRRAPPVPRVPPPAPPIVRPRPIRPGPGSGNGNGYGPPPVGGGPSRPPGGNGTGGNGTGGNGLRPPSQDVQEIPPEATSAGVNSGSPESDDGLLGGGPSLIGDGIVDPAGE